MFRYRVAVEGMEGELNVRSPLKLNAQGILARIVAGATVLAVDEDAKRWEVEYSGGSGDLILESDSVPGESVRDVVRNSIEMEMEDDEMIITSHLMTGSLVVAVAEGEDPEDAFYRFEQEFTLRELPQERWKQV